MREEPQNTEPHSFEINAHGGVRVFDQRHRNVSNLDLATAQQRYPNHRIISDSRPAVQYANLGRVISEFRNR